MRVLVCGGRHYNDLECVYHVLSNIHTETPISVIIEGGATGADRFGKTWGKQSGIPVETYKADWDDMSEPCVRRVNKSGKEYNALAGHKRNKRMLDEGKPDLVVAFKGGNGTKDMIEQSLKANVEVREINQ